MTILSLPKKVKLAVLSLSALLLGTSLQAATIEQSTLDRIQRDMNIMTKILETSLEQGRERNVRIEGVYLANQGMVFNVDPSHRFHFDMNDRNFAPVMPTAPIAPVVINDDARKYLSEQEIEEIEEEAMAAAESAMEMAEISIDFISGSDWSQYTNKERTEQRVIQKAMRDETRALEREARQLERDVREIERKLRDAEFEGELQDAKESEKVKSLKKEMNKLTDALTKVAGKIQEKSDALRKKAEAIRNKELEKQKKALAETEKVISQTVCDFGSGLRSLPNDQHISFNIEGKVDRLYIFTKQNIMQCGDGKINAAKMLENAIKYSL
ncbi:MAG: hypothetical protein ACJAZB_001067 [Psychrosphaera sp.]|jgi:hypothetical protein